MVPTFLPKTILRIYMGHGVIKEIKLGDISKISRRMLEIEDVLYPNTTIIYY